METRKESLCAMKVCRFCLTQTEPLSSLYEKSKAPKNLVTLSTKIMTCVAVEVFPSDKMPQYICNRCKLFMDLSYGFKQICRQADQNILHFVQQGTAIEPLAWPSMLNKLYKAHTKSEVGVVKTVTQDGATVKVTAEEISDSEEGDDDNVYSVKIEDGSEELKSIKVITSVDNQNTTKENRKADTKKPINEGCWPCDECECTYPLEQLLTLHKAHKHRARTAECSECDAKFFTKYDLTTHQLRHSTELPFQCVACDKKFKRLVYLKRHEKMTHSDLTQLKCDKCPATFLSEIELEAHTTRHRRRLHKFDCNICGKRCSDNSILQKHLDSHRVKPQFDCNYCPERFTTMTKLAKHLRTHAGERAYPCKHCDKSFIKSHHYTRHLRVKHMEATRSASGSYTEADAYRCEECEESFGTQDELIYHSALHATRSLTCPLCQEKFNDVDTVTAHIKSHVNGAEFMCDFCELIFTTEDKLDTHMTASHANELIDKDTTENEEDSVDMEGFEEEPTINVKEEDGHMVVEIKKAGDYMLVDSAMEEDDKNDNNSEGSELEISLNDASAPLLGAQPKTDVPPPALISAQKHQSPVRILENVQYVKGSPGSPNILKKAEEVKKKVFQQQPSPMVPNSTVKKDKLPTPAKPEGTGTAAAGASDLSLRLLEKELQDLKRTNTRNDVAKTPAKPIETLKSKRLLTTSTPKPRTAEKKDVPTPKTAPEKAPQDKRPPARALKETKEVKNVSVKEDKDKDKAIVTVKEDKETKEVKEKDTPKVVRNGANERASVEEPVRRSARPSKVKDYAKMISDSPAEEEESSDEEVVEEESKEAEKCTETPRRGRKPAPKPSPATTTRKRGRPRKGTPIVPTKVSKQEESDDEEIVEPVEATKDVKSNDSNAKTPEEMETKNPTIDLPPIIDTASDVIVSPTGQTLKKIPMKSLPPGVKPMPLPRKMPSGELCKMQIGKKVVKVQKIVMTKAEVEAMTKKGLVEMKDGTIVLKPGIKLGSGGAASLKSQLAAQEQNKEAPKAKPT